MHMGALRAIFEELHAFSNPAYQRKLQSKYVQEAETKASEQERANRGSGEEGEKGDGGGGGGGKEGDGVVPMTVAGDKLVAALSPDSAEPVHVFRWDNPEIVGMQIHFGYTRTQFSFCL